MWRSSDAAVKPYFFEHILRPGVVTRSQRGGNLRLIGEVVFRFGFVVSKVEQLGIFACHEQFPVPFAHGPLFLPLEVKYGVGAGRLCGIDDRLQAATVEFCRG